MRLSTQPLSLHHDLAVLLCSSDEVQKVPAVPTLKGLSQDSVCQTWIVTEALTENIEETLLVTRLPAKKLSLPLSLQYRPIPLVVDALPEVEVEEPEVKEPSTNCARSTSITHLVASIFRSISITDRLSTIRDFVGRMGVDVQFTKIKDEICRYLQAKLENSCRE